MPMNKKDPDEAFFLKLENGQEVHISWYKDWTKLDGVKVAYDHIEFRGPMTSTGYLSHHVPKDYGSQIDRDILIDHLKAVAEARWREYTGNKNTAQTALF